MNARSVLAVCLVAMLVCSGANGRELQAKASSIVSVASSVPELSILVKAVVAAGLAKTLSDPKLKVTVFAPTNAAFATLLKALKMTPEQLLADKALLTKVLTYHVVPVVAKSSALRNGQKLKTLQGQDIKVTGTGSKVTLRSAGGSKAKVVMANVAAGKAIVHVIDTVLVPKL